jgi:hypothetical protein
MRYLIQWDRMTNEKVDLYITVLLEKRGRRIQRKEPISATLVQ